MDPQLSKFERVIERLFARLSATYGRDFMGRWEGLDGDAVKASWAHELSGYNAALKPHPELVDNAALLHPIAWALENLPERAPNVIEFRALCRRAPAADVPRLAAPAADPVRAAQALAQLESARHPSRNGPVDHKAWARRHIANHAAGIKVSVGPLRMAREALGLPVGARHA
jgi:hypothetical protein